MIGLRSSAGADDVEAQDVRRLIDFFAHAVDIQQETDEEIWGRAEVSVSACGCSLPFRHIDS